LPDHAGLLREEVIARLASAVMLADVAVARGRATEPIDRPQTGRVEFAPAVPFDNLGPFIVGHHPLHLEEQIIVRAPPELAVEEDDLHAAAPEFFDQ
jgi:hypothetical protein